MLSANPLRRFVPATSPVTIDDAVHPDSARVKLRAGFVREGVIVAPSGNKSAQIGASVASGRRARGVRKARRYCSRRKSAGCRCPQWPIVWSAGDGADHSQAGGRWSIPGIGGGGGGREWGWGEWVFLFSDSVFPFFFLVSFSFFLCVFFFIFFFIFFLFFFSLVVTVNTIRTFRRHPLFDGSSRPLRAGGTATLSVEGSYETKPDVAIVRVWRESVCRMSRYLISIEYQGQKKKKHPMNGPEEVDISARARGEFTV